MRIKDNAEAKQDTLSHGREKPSQVDEEKTVYLSNCPECGNALEQTTSTYERIVEDIPPPQKMTT